MFKKNIDIKDISSDLINLYTLYESYAWENDRLKIKIDIDKFLLSISLYKDNKMIDYLNILFEENELSKYNFISLLFITKILEKRVIHYNSENNTFTNSKQLPYLTVSVENKEILNNLLSAINYINSNQDDKLYNFIDTFYANLKNKNKKIDAELDIDISTKISLTKVLKREGHYE